MYDIIGHRGVISFAPENTIASIIAARKINCNCIEADVILTKDNIPVIFHDRKLDRLTNHKGNICDYNYYEIKDIILKNTTERIPLLVDFLNKCSELSMNLMLELKNYTNNKRIMVKKIAKIIKNYNNITIFTCTYSKKILKNLNILYPNNNYIYIVDKIPDNWYENIQKYKCHGLFINYKENDIETIKSCAKTIPTYCFTINKIEDYNNLIDTDIKGIITDKPELFIEKCHLNK